MITHSHRPSSLFTVCSLTELSLCIGGSQAVPPPLRWSGETDLPARQLPEQLPPPPTLLLPGGRPPPPPRSMQPPLSGVTSLLAPCPASPGVVRAPCSYWLWDVTLLVDSPQLTRTFWRVLSLNSHQITQSAHDSVSSRDSGRSGIILIEWPLAQN